MITGKTIICLSTIDWHYAKQRHQIFMEHFLKSGNQVIFVEHLGFAPQQFRDIANISRRVVRALFGRQNLKSRRPPIPNLHIMTPLVLPPRNDMYNALNKYIFLPLLAKKILRVCAHQPIVWTYLATSTAVNLIRRLAPRMVIYDCVYDALRHPEAPFDIVQTEQALLHLADAVVTDGKYFFDEKKKQHSRVYQVPPGVDFEHFFRPSVSPAAAAAFDRIKKPRVCFFGCMGNEQKKSNEQSRIDMDLLVTMARQRPAWSIVLIGPLVNMELPECLRAMPNIHWLGYVPYQELPAYLAQCDALMLPYLVNQCTEVIMPAKLFECLATGKPVIATAMAELAFYGSVITIAHSAAEFLAHLDRVLTFDEEAHQQQRISFARDNTWEGRFKKLSEILEQAEYEKPRNKG